jgi:hypothetical protein
MSKKPGPYQIVELPASRRDTLNFIDFNPEDGDKITGILRYGSYLVVSKARSMAILTGDRTANYSVTWLEGESGAQGPKAMCGADKYLAFVAQDGIRFSDLTNSILATNRLMPSWDQINHRRLNQAAMVFWNRALAVGFLPFVAALPLSLFALAAVVRQCREPTRQRGAGLVAVTVVLFYAHASAYLVFVLVACAIAAASCWGH